MTLDTYEDTDQRIGGHDWETDMQAKDTAAWVKQYPLTTTYQTAQRAEQLRKYHDAKKAKAQSENHI